MSARTPELPIERPEATFPALTDEQVRCIEPFGEQLVLPAGAMLYRRGDRDIAFFVILEGEAEAFGVDRYGNEQVYVVLDARNFTGELNLFSNARSLVSTRAVTPLRVLRVERKGLRRVINTEPELGEILLRAFVLRRGTFIRIGRAGISIIGDPRDSRTLELRQFLTRNGYPHEVVGPDVPGDDGRTARACLSLEGDDLPAVWDGKQLLLKNPSLLELSQALGLQDELSPEHAFDVAIVGAGPAGLSAAVYASSEGLDTILIDTFGPGGQAGTSSRIENYLGFPNGLTGQDLASRAQIQAVKFGVHLSVARAVVGIRTMEDGLFELAMNEGAPAHARAVIVASGAAYRRLDVPESSRFDGHGVYYAATAMEAELCRREEVVVVGGGNSAGQAAVYLSNTSSKVIMLVRGRNLAASMSSYLVERIAASPRIELHFESEITRLIGNRTLEAVEWRQRGDKAPRTSPIRAVFVMIGAVPNTSWLQGCVELDAKGFVATGVASGAPHPSPFETTRPGIFAVGDVRSGSVKRVASAVGEGSVVLQWVHEYLSHEQLPSSPREPAPPPRASAHHIPA
ncbi:MAG: FAD-dependent oxidoreductase [Deltaproteobacteria bacterium]|nr:FAD-dependent oxidoreductase [Deltaproteobacteria bacterium]